MTLQWERQEGGLAEISDGQIWRYLIAGKPGEVVLTRYIGTTYSGPGRHGREHDCAVAAAAAAVNAIPIHPKAGGESFGSDLGVAREIAQQFEDGEDIFGHPPWTHPKGER